MLEKVEGNGEEENKEEENKGEENKEEDSKEEESKKENKEEERGRQGLKVGLEYGNLDQTEWSRRWRWRWWRSWG